MSDQTRPWPRLSAVQRWGPAALVLVVFAALGAVATTRSPSGTTTTKSPTTQASLADNPDLPRTYAEASQDGSARETTWANCDTTTGRIKFPSVYAPPCVPEATGSNGGATYQGCHRRHHHDRLLLGAGQRHHRLDRRPARQARGDRRER